MILEENEYFLEHNNFLTERAVEIPIGKKWIENKTNIIEIGAVLPSYFDDIVHDVVDPVDEKANIKKYLHEIDIKNKNVLSISTLEHIGLPDYGNTYLNENGASESIIRIVEESNTCLISVPYGYNKHLDKWITENIYNYNIFTYTKTSQNPLKWKYSDTINDYNIKYNFPFLFANMVIFIYK